VRFLKVAKLSASLIGTLRPPERFASLRMKSANPRNRIKLIERVLAFASSTDGLAKSRKLENPKNRFRHEKRDGSPPRVSSCACLARLKSVPTVQITVILDRV